MTKGKAVTLAVVLIVILSVFVVLASLGGKKVLSPVPEEPKIIWIKPSPSLTPIATPSPSGQLQGSPLPVKSTVKPTAKPTASSSPSL